MAPLSEATLARALPGPLLATRGARLSSPARRRGGRSLALTLPGVDLLFSSRAVSLGLGLRPPRQLQGPCVHM